jgi:alkanesulfonate monooxygenase SsuD/methylene tetrahydromethanopterin reductase-like flavin-dependent oxidoreductase (luciferase family)
MTTRRQPARFGLALREPHPWGELVDLVRHAEGLGATSVFLPEIASRDTLAALTGLAGETATIQLGTGVVPLPARRPQLLAMAAATVQERSGGRLVLGLGTGPAVPGSLARLRRTVIAIRDACSGLPAEVDGDPIQLSLIPPVPPKIWIAALGPRAARTAGEVADGVLLNWCPPARVERAREEVAAGAASEGRDPAAVTIAVYVRGSFGGDEASSATALRAAAAEYASYPAYARQLERLGLAAEASAAAAAHRAGRPSDVPQRLLDEVCLPGDVRAARERLEAYRAAGADVPVIYPVVPAGEPAGDAVRRTLDALVGDG